MIIDSYRYCQPQCFERDKCTQCFQRYNTIHKTEQKINIKCVYNDIFRKTQRYASCNKLTCQMTFALALEIMD
jgi:hypothetical protein